MMQLRPYQHQAIEALWGWWGERKGEHPLIVLPTASGKTVVFSSIIQRLRGSYPTRILVLAHRKELIGQAEQKLLSVWPEAPVGVYAAGMGRKETNAVTIASRDTIARSVNKLGRIDVVIVDEAHNISPREETRYRAIIAALLEQNPQMTVVGFTATPYRQGSGYIYGEDEKHLFAGVAFEKKIKEMIEEGWLCPIISKAVDGAIDTDGICTVAGDFAKNALSERATNHAKIATQLDEWERTAWNQGRRANVFFCVSVEHARLVAMDLLERGYSFPVIHGKTPQGERDQLLADFDAGRLHGIVNVGVLTEGWDAPRIDCIALLRPTRSLGLFVQIVGRGLRKHESKENCLLLDYGGCLDRFGPIDIAQPAAKKGDVRTKTCPECSEVVGVFKQKCTCGFIFRPPAFKECAKCGEENDTRARVCVACGELFPVQLERKASQVSVISESGRDLRTMKVDSVSLSERTSKKTGNPYLRVAYRVGLMNIYTDNIMLGYSGYAGDKARGQVLSMLRPGVTPPTTPAEAVNLLSGWREVHEITVDFASKYKDVVRVVYKDEVRQAA